MKDFNPQPILPNYQLEKSQPMQGKAADQTPSNTQFTAVQGQAKKKKEKSKKEQIASDYNMHQNPSLQPDASSNLQLNSHF